MASWQVLVDLNRDADFADAYEDITADVIGSLSWFVGCKPFKLMANEATLSISVNNSDRKYSPENTGSVLYDDLGINSVVRVKYDTKIMFTGVVVDIAPDTMLYGRQTAKLKIKSIKSLLDTTDYFPKLYENVTGDEPIQDILTQLTTPPTVTNVWILGVVGKSELGSTAVLGSISDIMTLDTGVQTFTMLGDNIQGARNNSNIFEYDKSPLVPEQKGTTAWKLIKDIVEAERGRFFFDTDGKGIFWNRNKLIDDVALDLTLDNNFENATYITPFNNFQNDVEVQFHLREESATSNEILWQLQGTMTIEAGETRTLKVNYKDDLGGKNVSVPSGADLVFSSGTAAVTIDAKAQRCEITLDNAGTVDAVLTTMILRGTTITDNSRVSIAVQDEISITDIGLTKTMRLKLRGIETFEDALDIADLELLRRATTTGRIETVTLRSLPTSTSDNQIAYGIGDRIRVKEDQSGSDLEYHVVGVKHDLDINSGGELTTTWHMEPATLTRIATYGKSNRDEFVSIAETATSYDKLAQKFQIARAMDISFVRLNLKKVGSPTGNLTLKIVADTAPSSPWLLGTAGRSELGSTTILGAEGGGDPNTTVTNGTSNTVSVTGLSGAARWVKFDFATPPSLIASTSYWLQLETSDGDNASNFMQWGADGSSPSYADGEMKQYDGVSWTQLSKDAIFEVYADI